jgi:hypothetical protein
MSIKFESIHTAQLQFHAHPLLLQTVLNDDKNFVLK